MANKNDQENDQENLAVDTRLRSLNEVMTRLNVPIPSKLLDKKPDKSGAIYVNITSEKDLLDWACGFGRHREEILQIIPKIETNYKKRGPGAMLGMTVRVHIQTLDEGWIFQDGTGTEWLTGSDIFGDPLTNAYAQAVRRAAESHCLARELWRKEISKPQARAKQALAQNQKLAQATKELDELPKAPSDEEQVDPAVAVTTDDNGLQSPEELRNQQQANQQTTKQQTATNGTKQATNGAKPSAAANEPPPQVGAHTLTLKELKSIQAAGGPVAPVSTLKTLQAQWKKKRPNESLDDYLTGKLGLEGPADITKQLAITLINALNAKPAATA